MKKLGKITSILNNNYLLAEIDSPIDIGSTVIAYEEIGSEKIKKETKLESIIFPKGELKVITREATKIYLLEIKLPTVKKTTRVGGSLALTLSGVNDLFGTPKEIEEVDSTQLLPVLDTSKSLNIKFNTKIASGDFVGIN